MAELDKSLLGPNRRALQPGEWACVDAKCAHVNAEKRSSCEICGKGKPRAKSRVGREIGKDAAEKSKGLFSADDWVCTKCGNVNWARRSVCNICNAPKLGDLEMRTGYGGGYMDRQDVEYIERDDDDEEFDEFGRKKKKRNRDDKTKPDFATDVPEALLETNLNDEEEEEMNDDEEDEGSDDGDLDKYDLTADPELFSFKADIVKTGAGLHDDNDRQSTISSDCSCSCSGGECSCVESDEVQSKKSKDERDEDRKHSSDRNKSKSSSSHKDSRGDRRNGDRKRDEERSDRGSRSDRERYRSRERDHYRDHR